MYKGKYYGLVNANCPYYEKDVRLSISCESIVDGSDKTMVKFETEQKKDRHINEYCLHYPNDCAIAKYLDNKYGAQ